LQDLAGQHDRDLFYRVTAELVEINSRAHPVDPLLLRQRSEQ
jgi:hypothetical protein